MPYCLTERIGSLLRKRQRHKLARASGVTFMLALGLQAFPPGPGLTVFGTVRDTYGWAMSDDDMVVFRSGSTEIARTRIRPDANFTENYRVMLPVDTNRSGDPYKSSALNGLVLFTVEVQAAGATYYPLESLTGPVSGGQAGGSLRLDYDLDLDLARFALS